MVRLCLGQILHLRLTGRETFQAGKIPLFLSSISNMSFTSFLISLFTSAFISSTLLPGGSEALVVWGMTEWKERLWDIVLVATAGNTLGALVTYLIGLLIPNKVDQKKIELFKKWGPICLLFTWVPIIGDAFPLAAGWLRVNWILTAVLILIGKFARYAALAYGTSLFL